MAYDKMLATAPPNEFPAYEIPIRLGISSLVYHIDVIYTKAGEMVASSAPVRNLTASNW
jgi:hypothetical protein